MEKFKALLYTKNKQNYPFDHIGREPYNTRMDLNNKYIILLLLLLTT